MSATATRLAIQAVNATVPGMGEAPADYPAGLAGARLPLALTYLGPGVSRWQSHGGGLRYRERTYVVRVFVARVESGRGVTQGIVEAGELLDAFVATWLDTPVLSTGAEVRITVEGGAVVGVGIRDSGIVHDLSYSDPAEKFRGFEAQITVWEWDDEGS